MDSPQSDWSSDAVSDVAGVLTPEQLQRVVEAPNLPPGWAFVIHPKQYEAWIEAGILPPHE